VTLLSVARRPVRGVGTITDMTDALVLLPSLDAYVAAFAALQNRNLISDNQRRMLKFHHASHGRAVSASSLATAVGFSGYEAANLQYGMLGSELCGALGLDLAEEKVGVLVDFVLSNQAGNTEILWVMRDRVAAALEELGWVPRVSQYLYPCLALRAQGADPDHVTAE
jgi:hypothetical protein